MSQLTIEITAGSLIKFPSNSSTTDYMAPETESPVITLSKPEDWMKFRDGERFFYADQKIHPVRAQISDAYSMLNDLDVRVPTNREYNIIAEDPEVAEQMREYFTLTGVLRNVRAGWKRRHKASYIESPDITETPEGRPLISGKEKKIILPPQGWFGTKEFLRSRTGLPQITHKRPPDGPCAFLMVQDGQEMALLRGHNYSSRYRTADERTEFAVTVYYKPTAIIQNLGLLAVSDQDPRPKPEKNQPI